MTQSLGRTSLANFSYVCVRSARAQVVQEWVQALEPSSVGSADEAPSPDAEQYDPVILIQEERAALAEQAKLAVEETERILEFPGTLPDEEQKVR